MNDLVSSLSRSFYGPRVQYAFRTGPLTGGRCVRADLRAHAAGLARPDLQIHIILCSGAEPTRPGGAAVHPFSGFTAGALRPESRGTVP